MLRRVSFQRCLFGGLILALVLAAGRALAIQGWFYPRRIISGSMAERLLGEHYLATCFECAFAFPYGVESLPLRELAVCPNCGYGRNQVRSAERRRGQRVLVDRGAYWFSSPARFDVVAFDHPLEPGRPVVKRLAGLPGERIAIQRGELFADGRFVRKSLAQFRQMATIVHDDRYRTRDVPALPRRWRPPSGESGWQSVEFGYECPTPESADHGGIEAGEASRESAVTHTAIKSTGFAHIARENIDHPTSREDSAVERDMPEFDWLVYHHWRCYANQYPRTSEAPVSDNVGYNQGESRALQEVNDLVLRCRLVTSGDGEFAIRVHDGWEWTMLRIDPAEKSAVAERGGRRISSCPLPRDCDARDCEVEFGVIDEQLLFAVDRQQCLRETIAHDHSGVGYASVSRPVAVGARALAATVTGLILLRDVYYLDPANVGTPWEMAEPLPHDAYFALGDNPSLSEDSRQWPGGRVAAQDIVGKILPLPW